MAVNTQPFRRDLKANQTLVDDATKAVRMLITLTELQDQGDETSSVMPRAALASAKGVCFSHTMRAALAIGYQYGRAFALARLEDSCWSAPLYLTINKLSIGVSYGMGTVDSCIVMDSATDVQSLTRGQPMLGTDARIMVCAEKSRAVEGDEPGVYSISDGTMVDICLAGGAMVVDGTQNAELYGPSATPEDILCGRVPSPPEFDPLYRALDALIASTEQRDDVSSGVPDDLPKYSKKPARKGSKSTKKAASKDTAVGPSTPPMVPPSHASSAERV